MQKAAHMPASMRNFPLPINVHIVGTDMCIPVDKCKSVLSCDVIKALQALTVLWDGHWPVSSACFRFPGGPPDCLCFTRVQQQPLAAMCRDAAVSSAMMLVSAAAGSTVQHLSLRPRFTSSPLCTLVLCSHCQLSHCLMLCNPLTLPPPLSPLSQRLVSCCCCCCWKHQSLSEVNQTSARLWEGAWWYEGVGGRDCTVCYPTAIYTPTN